MNLPAHVSTLELDVWRRVYARVCDRVSTGKTRRETYELLTRTCAFLRGNRLFGDVPVLARLRSVEPATDAQSCVRFFVYDDFLDRMEALPGLYLKEDELVPAWWDRFDRRDLRLGDVLARSHGIKLERPTVLCAPWFVARKGHVQDIGYPARTDYIVVVEEVATTGI